ncbi:uncharacterized protein BJ212DRAFT_1300893 [Suillus subaureus]|uniref:Uncharacterized protein n=1 Tax=Suillus subaureus TaxID=48587 RepID=A0A9P7E980_9AGAM|nr:uncharacterized protein BJ212DRAFT_1300893 [Suillus subaureus]KAG1814039.1 hypothetical protein BJ212DRAFT_1300893 [Suillus subaureus]
MHEDLQETNAHEVMPNLGPNFNTPEALLQNVPHFEMYNRATAVGACPLTPYITHNLPPDLERRRFEQELEDAIDEIWQEQSHQQDDDTANPEEPEGDGDVDMDFNNPEDEEDDRNPIITQPDEDNLDPFVVEDGFVSMDDTDLASIPPHLLSIYAVVSWLHLQFHLPRIACNLCVHHICMKLAQAIKSLLKVPGLKTVLDDWHCKSRSPGHYGDIFDGTVCRTKLKGLDGKLFFSNLPHEKCGPDSELQIGVNLGVDWFSYICSNIAPSHSLCLTSFSICNLPPEYWCMFSKFSIYCTSNLMCTGILPGPKEQSPDQIQ